MSRPADTENRAKRRKRMGFFFSWIAYVLSRNTPGGPFRSTRQRSRLNVCHSPEVTKSIPVHPMVFKIPTAVQLVTMIY